MQLKDKQAACMAIFHRHLVRGAPDECWPWHRLSSKGYGQVTAKIGGGKQASVSAHKLSYISANGPIPEGQIVRHSCDNPPCVNPAHLKLGTFRDNTLDAQSKGRLRGQDQTHCIYGHPFNAENTYYRPGGNGSRTCRKCDAARQSAYRARKRERIAQTLPGDPS
jgi:hypothetical protein